MSMPWFIPLALLIGVAGTRTAMKSRHAREVTKRDRGLWLLLALAWLPSLCWLLAQFVDQG